MNELHNDRLLKDIVQNSRMEITTPDFEEMMMRKILAHDKKRKAAKNILLYAVIFLAVDAILFTLLKLLNLQSGGVGLHHHPVLPQASQVTNSVQSFLAENTGWLIPMLGVIFLFSVISWAGSGLGSSRIRQS